MQFNEITVCRVDAGSGGDTRPWKRGLGGGIRSRRVGVLSGAYVTYGATCAIDSDVEVEVARAPHPSDLLRNTFHVHST